MSQEPANSSPSPQPKGKRKSPYSQRERLSSTPKQPPSQPFWKNILINLLRGTSGFLETAAVKLETEQQSNTEKTVGTWQKLQLFGNQVLSKIRGVLPENLQVKFTTPAWIGIIAIIVAIAIWTISSLFATKPTSVVNVTSPQETTLPSINGELEVKPTPLPEPKPTPEPEITLTPTVKETPPPEPEITPTPTVKETPPPEPEITPTPTVKETPPPKPEITLTPTVKETPPPEPEITLTPTPVKKIVLTPEQALIKAIENQVADISDRFASGLIQSIQAEFRTSSLTIIIGDQWYDLPTSEQRKLAAQMLQRSQELDFSHLEIMDSQKRLIARNPIVGTEMIIFTPIVKTIQN